MNLSRRDFMGLSVAGLSVPLLGAVGEVPRLRFGVITDVHIGGRKDAPQKLQRALSWLKNRGVDVVLCGGDVAHSGRIAEMEKFAEIWHSVFPKGCGVDIFISTGNHDADDAFWGYASAEYQKKNRLCYGDNANKIWQRWFDQPFELVWRREVKGYTFLGSQWPSLKPNLEAYMQENADSFDSTKPFFYIQHQHPRRTCHGGYSCGDDNGHVGRAFAHFPNAVAFSGHSHCSIVDERSVWQGAFTSIGAGCLHEGGLQFGYDNASAFWHPSGKKNLMQPLNDAVERWGGNPDGGCFEYVEVFEKHLVVYRRSSVYDLEMGEPWIIPLPATKQSAFDFATQKQKRAQANAIPQFAQGAQLKVQVCKEGHPLESKVRQGEACVAVDFPCAQAVGKSRVWDYAIKVKSGEKCVKESLLFAAGFGVPMAHAQRGETWLVALKDLPQGEQLVFEVTPRDCFGLCGCALVSEAITL